MNNLKRILVLTLALAMMLVTTACGSSESKKTENENYDLTVKYYSGAYGDDWIKLASEEFAKEKGVKVQVIPSSDMDCGAENNLTAGKIFLTYIFVLQSVGRVGFRTDISKTSKVFTIQPLRPQAEK